MKLILIAAACSMIAGPVLAQGQTYVPGRINRDGSYTQGHYRTNPNSTRTDNWSSAPNVNPYTGRRGTVNPYATPRSTYTPPSAYKPYKPYRVKGF